MKKLIISLCIIALFTGCAQIKSYRPFRSHTVKFSPQSLEMLKLGMTRAQIKEILGPPNSTTVTPRAWGDIVEVWEYKEKRLLPELSGAQYFVYFVNDIVSKWGPRDTLESL